MPTPVALQLVRLQLTQGHIEFSLPFIYVLVRVPRVLITVHIDLSKLTHQRHENAIRYEVSTFRQLLRTCSTIRKSTVLSGRMSMHPP